MAFSKITKMILVTLTLCFVCCVGLCGCESDALKTTAQKDTKTQAVQEVSQTDKQTDTTQAENASADSSSSKSSASSSSQESERESSEPEAHISVSITVNASAADRGTFVSTTVSLPEGASVFDALCATGLAFSGDGNYVASINGLSEFDFGSASGWMYNVNGVEPAISCGSYVLNDGDTVYWYYTK